MLWYTWDWRLLEGCFKGVFTLSWWLCRSWICGWLWGWTALALQAQRMLWLTAASTPHKQCHEAMWGSSVPAGEFLCHRESRIIQVLSFLPDLWIFDSTMAPVNPISISPLNLDWRQQNSVQSHSPVPGFHPGSHSSCEYLTCFSFFPVAWNSMSSLKNKPSCGFVLNTTVSFVLMDTSSLSWECWSAVAHSSHPPLLPHITVSK